MTSKHPYKPYIPKGATKLIVGTIPPYRFCVKSQVLFDNDVNFYYGSKDNYFWDLFSEITGVKLDRNNSSEAINQRQALLNEYHIGITDVVDECIHKDGKSTDDDLDIISLKPIKELLAQNPDIDSLYYTSQFVIKQMNTFADKKWHDWKQSRRKGTVRIGGKEYNVVVLYSPSPLACRRVSREKKLAQYKEAFVK